MVVNKPEVGIAIWTFLCHSHINVHEHKFMKFFFSMPNICLLDFLWRCFLQNSMTTVMTKDDYSLDIMANM